MTSEVKAKKEPLPYNAQQRAQAVLSIWTERRRPREVCQELAIRPAVLSHWEKRALAAMVEALGNRGHGRPLLPIDPEKEALQRQRQELQARLQVMEQTVRIRQWLESPDKEKNEVAEMIVTTLSRLKRQAPWPYQRLCEYLALPYSSFRRWKHRLERGQPVLFKPGPKKVAPLNLEELHIHLCRLKHGRRRSRGVGRLYRQYRGQISRRDLQALTETVRREFTQQRQAELCRITWHVPGLVWSLDDTPLARLASQQLHLHQVQDLASRYKFTPWVGDRALGETVALRLEQLFLRHGPPLAGQVALSGGMALNLHSPGATTRNACRGIESLCRPRKIRAEECVGKQRTPTRPGISAGQEMPPG